MNLYREEFSSSGYEDLETPLETYEKDVNEHYKDMIDAIEDRVNNIIESFDIDDISDLYKISEGVELLKDLAKDLY